MSDKKREEYESKLDVLQDKLIDLCVDIMEEFLDKIDKICIYCCIERTVHSFSFFSIMDNKIRTMSQLGIDDPDATDDAFDVIEEIEALFKEYEMPRLNEIKIIFDVKKKEYEPQYKYEPMPKMKLPSQMCDEWKDEIRRSLEPKSEQTAKSAKKSAKLMSLKKVWSYKHEGVRGPVVSTNALVEDDKLTYFLEYKKSGFYESQLMRFDMKEQEKNVLFTEPHVIRSIGIRENGRRYFTSMSAMVYCLNDETGEIIWQTKAGRGNASSSIKMDDKFIYMYNGRMFCIDKENGEIVWQSQGEDKHGASVITLNGDYLYHCTSGESFYCMDKRNGEIVWNYGDNLYARECLMIGTDKILVSTANALGKLFLLDVNKGELISEVTTEAPIYGQVVMAENYIYTGNEAGELFCFELTKDNKLVQKFRLLADSGYSGAVLVDENIVWFGTEKGYLYGLDRMTGEEVAKKKKVAANPRWMCTYEDGLLILSDKGQIEFYQK